MRSGSYKANCQATVRYRADAPTLRTKSVSIGVLVTPASPEGEFTELVAIGCECQAVEFGPFGRFSRAALNTTEVAFSGTESWPDEVFLGVFLPEVKSDFALLAWSRIQPWPSTRNDLDHIDFAPGAIRLRFN